MVSRLLTGALLLGLTRFLAPEAAQAASKIAVAALGDAAPGGGVFVGPSFVSEPSAAGAGWVAFRTLVTDDPSPEVIVANNFVTRDRVVVARIGQTVSDTVGRIKQFLGRPTINANGDVAFVATTTPPDDAPPPGPLDPLPAGVFLWNRSQSRLTVIAAPGLDTGFGLLDLTTTLNVLSTESGIDVAERTPALNDAGDVAFVSATLDGARQGGAIFFAPAGGALAPVVKLGDEFQGGRFAILGPPALNNRRTMAFRGFLEGALSLDGVFVVSGGATTLLIRDDPDADVVTVPTVSGEPVDGDLFEFGDVVALNDAGDVLCTVSELYDAADFGAFDGSPGVILIRAGGNPVLVGFPGQRVDLLGGRVSTIALSPDEGSRTAPPAFTPDGRVVFFAEVNDGSSQAILRVDPDTATIRPLVRLGGARADATPLGGVYRSASSGPALDGAGNLAFSARIDTSSTSEGLIWVPVDGGPAAADGIAIGDAVPAPGQGFVGGPAFFPPTLNDAGDVVFKSFVARGPALGIFRWRAGALDAVVRVGDPAPLDGAPPFVNLVGEPSLNEAGDVAFIGTAKGLGNGAFVTRDGVLRKVAMPADDLIPPDPDRPGAFIKSVAASPSLSDSGEVVFRGVVQYESRFGILFPDERENCVFLADASGIRIIAAEGQESGAGARRFASFRDPTIRGRSVLFRAPLQGGQAGLFLRDDAGVRAIAVEGEAVSGMTLETLQGKGFADTAGDVFFKIKLAGDRGAVMQRSALGFAPLLETGQRGPEGGRVRSLGRLGVSSNGHVALRVGFDTLSGGVPGVFLVRDGDVRSYLRIAENGPAGLDGRITSVSQSIAVNSTGRMALLGTIGGGKARSAVLLAAPAALRVRQLAVRRGPGSLLSDRAPKPRDRVRVSAVLEPGLLPEPKGAGTGPVRRKQVTVSIADQRGRLWSGTLAAADTQLRGKTLTRKRSARASQIQGLKVKFTRRKGVRVAVRSKPFDLTFSAQGLRRFDDTGAVILEPPLSVRIDLGEDGASVVVPCTPKPRRFTCGG